VDRPLARLYYVSLNYLDGKTVEKFRYSE